MAGEIHPNNATRIENRKPRLSALTYEIDDRGLRDLRNRAAALFEVS